jgi:hypothetical protein
MPQAVIVVEKSFGYQQKIDNASCTDIEEKKSLFSSEPVRCPENRLY